MPYSNFSLVRWDPKLKDLFNEINVTFSTFYRKASTLLSEPEEPFYIQASQEPSFKQYESWCTDLKKLMQNSIRDVITKKIDPKILRRILLDKQESLQVKIISPFYYHRCLNKTKQKIAEIYTNYPIYVFEEAYARLRKKLQDSPEITLYYFYNEILNHLIKISGQQISVKIIQWMLSYYQEFIPKSLYSDVLTVIQQFLYQYNTEFKNYFYTPNIPKRVYLELIKNINSIFSSYLRSSQINNDEENAILVANTNFSNLHQTLVNAITYSYYFINQALYFAKKAKKFAMKYPKQTIILGMFYQASFIASTQDNPIFALTDFSSEQKYDPAISYLFSETFVATWSENTGYPYLNLWKICGLMRGGDGSQDSPIWQDRFDVTGFIYGEQYKPSITGLTNKGYVIVWEYAENLFENAANICGILNSEAGIINPEATEYEPDEYIVKPFQINTTNFTWCDEAKVASSKNNDFIIIWEGTKKMESSFKRNIYGQFFNANGMHQGDEFVINTSLPGSQQFSSIAYLEEGFVVVWVNSKEENSWSNIFGQLFHANGTCNGSEFLISNYADPIEGGVYPSIASLGNNSFVVVWQKAGIHGQVCNGFTCTGNEFHIDDISTQEKYGIPVVAGMNNGSFVMIWSSNTSGNKHIYGQLFDTDKTRLGEIFQVSEGMDDDNSQPAVICFNSTHYFVIWVRHTRDYLFSGIYGRILPMNEITSNNILVIIIGTLIGGMLLIAPSVIYCYRRNLFGRFCHKKNDSSNSEETENLIENDATLPKNDGAWYGENLHKLKQYIENLNNFQLADLQKLVISKARRYKQSEKESDQIYNHQLIKRIVCKLLGISEIKYDLFHYLALLRSRTGAISKIPETFIEDKDPETGKTIINQILGDIEGYKLEGWNAGDFLATRIYFFLLILVELEKGLLTGINKPSDEKLVKEKLYAEIVLGVCAFKAYLIRCNLNNLDKTDLEEAKQAYAKKLVEQVARLKNEEEIYYPTGFQRHTLYVNFQSIDNYIVIRVDNLGAGRDEYRHPRSEVEVLKENKIIKKVKYRPRLLGMVSFKHFVEQNQSSLQYFINLIDAALDSSDTGLAKVYQYPVPKDLEDIEFQGNWPARSAQKVGNCVVKNHNVGLMYRFFKNKNQLDNQTNREHYKWIRAQEEKQLITRIDKGDVKIINAFS